jgi:hypothetical protein
MVTKKNDKTIVGENLCFSHSMEATRNANRQCAHVEIEDTEEGLTEIHRMLCGITYQDKRTVIKGVGDARTPGYVPHLPKGLENAGFGENKGSENVTLSSSFLAGGMRGSGEKGGEDK